MVRYLIQTIFKITFRWNKNPLLTQRESLRQQNGQKLDFLPKYLFKDLWILNWKLSINKLALSCDQGSTDPETKKVQVRSKNFCRLLVRGSHGTCPWNPVPILFGVRKNVVPPWLPIKLKMVLIIWPRDWTLVLKCLYHHGFTKSPTIYYLGVEWNFCSEYRLEWKLIFTRPPQTVEVRRPGPPMILDLSMSVHVGGYGPYHMGPGSDSKFWAVKWGDEIFGRTSPESRDFNSEPVNILGI